MISLLKTEHHYYGLTSIPALLNRNYFCRVCEKGYHEESAREHNCVGQNCTACRRGKKACPNFAKWVTPELYCDRCHIRFYGPECFEAHLRKKRGQRSVCESYRKCLESCAVYKIDRKEKHQCYQTKCRNCGKVTSVNHDCCIQPMTEDKTKEQAAAGVRLVDAEAGKDSEDSEAEETSRPPLEPLLFFADFECTVNENQEFEVNKGCWSYEDDDVL